MRQNLLLLLLLQLLLLLLGCQLNFAFMPDTDVSLDFMNETQVKEHFSQMLFNTDSKKMAQDLSKVGSTQRLTDLKYCRIDCSTKYESQADFHACNTRCQDKYKEGDFGKIKDVGGGKKAEKKAEKQGSSEL